MPAAKVKPSLSVAANGGTQGGENYARGGLNHFGKGNVIERNTARSVNLLRHAGPECKDAPCRGNTTLGCNSFVTP